MGDDVLEYPTVDVDDMVYEENSKFWQEKIKWIKKRNYMVDAFSWTVINDSKSCDNWRTRWMIMRETVRNFLSACLMMLLCITCFAYLFKKNTWEREWKLDTKSISNICKYDLLFIMISCVHSFLFRRLRIFINMSANGSVKCLSCCLNIKMCVSLKIRLDLKLKQQVNGSSFF